MSPAHSRSLAAQSLTGGRPVGPSTHDSSARAAAQVRTRRPGASGTSPGPRASGCLLGALPSGLQPAGPASSGRWASTRSASQCVWPPQKSVAPFTGLFAGPGVLWLQELRKRPPVREQNAGPSSGGTLTPGHTGEGSAAPWGSEDCGQQRETPSIGTGAGRGLRLRGAQPGTELPPRLTAQGRGCGC